MKRKYDIRNKKNFVLILVLSIAVICIFSLFIYKYKQAGKIEYLIETGSVIQDTDKNFINVEADATLKIRWNDNYYLIYQDKKINLGKKVIVYNTITGGMKLYGNFYEIEENGKIVDYKDETVLANTTDTKFYKLADREYLLVDRRISSMDGSIEADNYLLVELDKLGNAKLSNYKLNLKTITPTVLVTSKYRFDIANEILNFGAYDIDLKKILGSSNQYKPEEDDDSDGEGGTGTGTGTGSGTGTGDGNGNGNGSGSGTGTGMGTGDGTGGSGDVINNNESGNITDIEQIKDKTKMTSIVRFTEGLTQIDFDYVIYDPYNEYKSVYAEIIKPESESIEVIHLSKNDTHMVLNNLLANTEYKVKFIYTTLDSETNKLVSTTFEELTLKTKMPVYKIGVQKVSKFYNYITYEVFLQEGYSIDKVNVNLSFDYTEVVDTETMQEEVKTASIPSTVPVVDGVKSVRGTIDITGYSIDEDALLKLTVVSVEKENEFLDIDSSYTFRFGR